ncbi:MAG: hypothetical protein ACRDH9_01750 [Actinomycetota bacterium]
MAMVNGVAQEFWSEVFNLHAPLDEKPRTKRSKARSKKLRRVLAREARLARAS